ncbi:MAG: M15 family metallopeptidase [Lachnospiraceae bacterium]|nr:M15 family metallopeptidase [Lachnospiraceae bacterium]
MRDVTQLHPTLQQKINQLLELCKKNGISIKVGECVRTVAEQDALYAQGRTKAGSIVTNAKGSTYSSMHQWGIAFDFYLDMDIDGDGTKSDDAFNNRTGMFNKVGALGKSIGLEWGGDWKSIVDLPHFQLPDWGSTATKLRNTYGTPEKFRATWSKTSNSGSTTTSSSSNTSSSSSSSEYSLKDFVKDVQSATGAKVDGIAGKETLSKTVTVSAKVNKKHAVVKAIQKRLNALGYICGTADGIAGAKFTAAVNSYQSKVLKYRTLDGEVTKSGKMWKSLLGMS